MGHWSGASTNGPAAQARVQQGRGHVSLVEPADVGAGRDDLVDPVEDLVGERDVEAGEHVIELFHDAGLTERRHVRPRGPIGHIGKEANRWEEQFHLGANPEAQITYGSPVDELALYRQAVAERASQVSVPAIADRAGVSIGTVSAVQRGIGNPSRETLAAIDRAVSDPEVTV